MLEFERELVATLTTTADPVVRGQVSAFVEDSLSDMPEFLRLGVLVESIGFGLIASARRGPRARTISLVETSPVPLVRQYVRLFRSLVLFAEQELLPA